MTSTGFSGVGRASWLVSTPTPVFIPRLLLPDPTHSRELGVGDQRPGRLGLSGDGLVGAGRTRSSDPTASSKMPSAERVRDSWKEDALFGYQFLNGTNPMLLRRSVYLPARLEFPPGMWELQAELEKELQVST